jgi:hypothetical protein
MAAVPVTNVPSKHHLRIHSSRPWQTSHIVSTSYKEVIAVRGVLDVPKCSFRERASILSGAADVTLPLPVTALPKITRKGNFLRSLWRSKTPVSSI